MLQTNLSGTIPRQHPETTSSVHRQPSRRRTRGLLANTLGWFSIGLGLAELIAPRRVARSIGLRDTRRTRQTMIAAGVREVVTGLGILVAVRRTPWLWLRVGGDALDLALLGTAMRAKRTNTLRLGVTLGTIAGIAALDAFAARRMTLIERVPGAGPSSRTVIATTTINRAPDDVYAYFRDFRNLPTFMTHVESIEVTDDKRSHWTVRGPAGTHFEWDAEIIDDSPGELIAWRSLPGADVYNDGIVRFMRAPGDRGTEVHAEIRYRGPAGDLGAAFAKLFGREPGQQASADLRRLKQMLEIGEVVVSDASLHRGIHPAQPPTERFLAREAARRELAREARDEAQDEAQEAAQ
jgi:uncharacterized membrane protein